MTDGGRRFLPEESFRFSQNDKRQWLRSTCWVLHLRQKSKGVGCFFFFSLLKIFKSLYFFFTSFCFIINRRRKKNRFSVYLNGAASIVKLFYLMQSITCMACGFWFRCGVIYKCPQRKTTRHKFFAQEIKNQKRATERMKEKKNRCHRIKHCECVHCALCLT